MWFTRFVGIAEKNDAEEQKFELFMNIVNWRETGPSSQSEPFSSDDDVADPNFTMDGTNELTETGLVGVADILRSKISPQDSSRLSL